MADEKEQSPWITLLIGIGCMAIGIGSYFYFSGLEEKGGSFRTHALIVLLYTTMGKNGVLWFFEIIGVLLLGIGVKELMQGKK